MATFKHRSIANFKIGNFQFKNHILSLTKDEDIKAFTHLAKSCGPRVTNQITVVNEEALASLESSFGSKVIRGAQDSGETAAKAKEGEADRIDTEKLRREAEERLKAAGTQTTQPDGAETDKAKTAENEEAKTPAAIGGLKLPGSK